jgi:hypothetical protein
VHLALEARQHQHVECVRRRERHELPAGVRSGLRARERSRLRQGAVEPRGEPAGLSCSLATAADVGAAYGESFNPGKSSTPGGYSNCLFTQAGGGGGDSVSLTVATGSDVKTFYDDNEAAFGVTTFVHGLGDTAFVTSDGGEIGVMKGNTAFVVHVVGFSSVGKSALQAKQQAFATKVLANLH